MILGVCCIVHCVAVIKMIESKDHMWKPAPIVGRDFVQREVEVNIPVSQQLRNAQN